MKCFVCNETIDTDDHWEVEGAPACDDCFEDLSHDPRYADMVIEAKEDQVVDRPTHYTSHPSGIECILITEDMDFCLGNAYKYMFRRKSKSTIRTNLKKARYYVRRKISGGRMASLPPESGVRGIVTRKRAVTGGPVSPEAQQAQRRVLDSSSPTQPGAAVPAPDSSGDVLRAPASFGEGTAPIGRPLGLFPAEPDVSDPGGRAPEEEGTRERDSIRRVAHVYQSEEQGYREAMLLVWAVSQPKEALHLALEVMSGLK